MQSEMAGAADRMFRQLTDADLKFGMCRNEKGERGRALARDVLELFLRSPRPQRPPQGVSTSTTSSSSGHENSLTAALLQLRAEGRVLRQGPRLPERPRGVAVSRQRAGRRVRQSRSPPCAASCRRVYEYFELRRKKMRLRDIHHYDTYVPILSELDTRHTWNQAVDVGGRVARSRSATSIAACSHDGLAGRWCDRYPNQGKRSGAFSSGSTTAGRTSS